jgi:hypothetical protein
VYRPSRQNSVFSLSAIDLFACAAGAFILLSLILFQYYRNTTKQIDQPEPAPTISAVSIEDLDDARKAIDQLNEALARRDAVIDQLRADAEKNRQLAFLGITTSAKSFVILIDASGSMVAYDHLMRRTIAELIEPMDSAYRVQMITFQGHIMAVPKPFMRTWAPSGELVAMDAAAKTSAMSFVNKLQGTFDGGTPTFMALKAALEYDVEAIFLVTDGEPNDLDRWQDIVRLITAANNGRKTIYTVGIGYYRDQPDFVDFLDDIASKNGGKFLGVSD